MKNNLSTRLKHRVTLYAKESGTNELGETDYNYHPIKTLWAEIVPARVNLQSVYGAMDYEKVTHKVTIRANVVDIETDMYFMYGNVKLDINTYYPQYKDNDRIEIFCVEDIGYGGTL